MGKTIAELKKENEKLKQKKRFELDVLSEKNKKLRERNSLIAERKKLVRENKELKRGKFSRGLRSFGKTLAVGAKVTAKQVAEAQRKKAKMAKRYVPVKKSVIRKQYKPSKKEDVSDGYRLTY